MSRKSIIGELFLTEKSNIERSEKNKGKIFEKEFTDEVLRNDLTPSQTELYQKYCDIAAEMERETELANFKAGFKLGLLLGIETVE